MEDVRTMSRFRGDRISLPAPAVSDQTEGHATFSRTGVVCLFTLINGQGAGLAGGRA